MRVPNFCCIQEEKVTSFGFLKKLSFPCVFPSKRDVLEIVSVQAVIVGLKPGPYLCIKIGKGFNDSLPTLS